MLRDAGLPCPVVSVGSSPTAHFARNLDGVTEVREGVFVFFALVMSGIGFCTLDDIALSVLTTVIGHQPDKGRSEEHTYELPVTNANLVCRIRRAQKHYDTHSIPV